MSKTKLYISATLFLLLTMLKFAFPPLAVDIRDAVIPALTKDADYKSAMSDIGKSLSASDGILDTLEGMIRQDGDTLEAGENLISSPVRDNYMPMTIGELHSDFTAPARQAGDTQSADGEKAEVSEDAPETTSVPESAPPETQLPRQPRLPSRPRPPKRITACRTLWKPFWHHRRNLRATRCRPMSAPICPRSRLNTRPPSAGCFRPGSATGCTLSTTRSSSITEPI